MCIRFTSNLYNEPRKTLRNNCMKFEIKFKKKIKSEICQQIHSDSMICPHPPGQVVWGQYYGRGKPFHFSFF